MEFLYPVLSVIDRQLLLILAVIVGVAALAAFIKRVFKVGAILVCIACVFMLLRPAVDLANQQYGIKMNNEDKTITLTVAGKEYHVLLNELRAAMKDPRTKVEFIRQEARTGMVLKYYKADGNVINESIPVPDFMLEPLLKTLDKAGITYKYDEYKQ